ncbi:annexin D5-like [Carica papaya]|uniref:annexin D5-like n=1 Tax=Carica papaya TaxID=3649 RepID=UPI000B8CAF40|nr:annexin D5-like [Carica papaya]
MATNQGNSPFARVAYLRMSKPQERDAEIMRHSLFGGRINLHNLIEVACTRSSLELHFIKQAYNSRFNSNLEQDMGTKLNSGFKEILLAVMKSSQYYAGKADTSMAMCDAKTLYEAVETGKTIDQRSIVLIMSQRNTGQIKAILSSYRQLYGHEFSKAIKQSKCGQFGKELRVMIRCIQNPGKFFAKQLRMKSGDGRELLIRVVVTRSGIDIKDINNAFTAKTGSSLENLVRREFNNKDSKTNGIVAAILTGLIRG